MEGEIIMREITIYKHKSLTTKAQELYEKLRTKAVGMIMNHLCKLPEDKIPSWAFTFVENETRRMQQKAIKAQWDLLAYEDVAKELKKKQLEQEN